MPKSSWPAGRVLGVPAHAAVEPSMRALHRRARVVAVHVERRALVERQRDVRAQGRLDLHRGLGAHEPLRTVGVRAESNSVLVDRQDPLWRLASAALDLRGHRAVAHGEHLEAAGVGDDRPGPAHELVQPAHLAHLLVTGLDEQVEGVAQHHLVAEPATSAASQAAHAWRWTPAERTPASAPRRAPDAGRPRGRTRRGRRCEVPATAS